VTRTQQLLEAIADPDAFAMLEILRRGPKKQTRLAEEAGVAAGTASARIDVLVALGVIRRPTARSELSISEAAGFEEVIRAADALNGLLLGSAMEDHQRRTSGAS
jgi:DNA-binding Lrp family transcriptional regulator